MAAEQKTTDTRTNAQSAGLESRKLTEKLSRPLEPDYKCGFDGWDSGDINCPKCLSDSPFHELDDEPSTESEQSKHTPGPWKASGDLDGIREDYREDRCIITEDFDEENRTGSIIGVLRGHGPELRANARLIAAAPDMLDALKTLFRECAMVHKHWGENCNQAAADAAVTKANAAIFKAEAKEKIERKRNAVTLSK